MTNPAIRLVMDCTLNATVLNPETDPMIHQAFPGGIDELKEYVMELKGFKDHWVKNMNDPDDTRWEYTYHGRLAAIWILEGKHVKENGKLVERTWAFR